MEEGLSDFYLIIYVAVTLFMSVFIYAPLGLLGELISFVYRLFGLE